MAQNRVIIKKSLSDDLRRRLSSGHVVAGIPKGSDSYPDGTSIMQVATDHEFGSDTPRTYTSPRGNTVSVSGTPERSFIRSTGKEKRGEWADLVRKQIKSVITGNNTSIKMFGRVGLRASADIKKKIVDISDPPNSPQVIADKGSSNPLIDTSHMLGAVTYEVRG
jgi:hypothetical protein